MEFPYREVEGDDPRADAEEKIYSHADMLERMRWVMSYIRSKDRARVTVDCIYLALGDAELEEVTMTSVGENSGLTKAAISKRAKEVRRQLHLGINQNNKSPHAARRYAGTNYSPVRLAS